MLRHGCRNPDARHDTAIASGKNAPQGHHPPARGPGDGWMSRIPAIPSEFVVEKYGLTNRVVVIILITIVAHLDDKGLNNEYHTNNKKN